MTDILLIIGAYFIGTFPSAYICGQLFVKSDIRQLGSGNVGALNTAKTVGYLPGILTLLADIAKGALAVYLAALYSNWLPAPFMAAFFVVLGHNYNIFLGFRGGKGLGSLVGAMALLAPLAAIYALAVIVMLALLLRDTNTASGIGVFSLPLFLYLQEGHWALLAIGTAIAIIVALKHGRDFKAYRQGRRKLL